MIGRKGPGNTLIDIEYTVRDVIYAPLSKALAETLGEAAFIAASWTGAPGITRSIVGRDCLGESIERGNAIPDVVSVAGQTLKTGAPTVWLTGADGFVQPDRVDEERVYAQRRERVAH